MTVPDLSQADRKAEIQRLIREREQMEGAIRRIVQDAEPRYHWLDYWISYFWVCAQSPFGWCLFRRDETGVLGDDGCIYCGNPMERK